MLLENIVMQEKIDYHKLHKEKAQFPSQQKKEKNFKKLEASLTYFFLKQFY